MGIGAMSTVMLKLPLTSVLVASLLVASAGSSTIPLIIVAATVAYVGSAYFAPVPANAGKATELMEEAAAGGRGTVRHRSRSPKAWRATRRRFAGTARSPSGTPRTV